MTDSIYTAERLLDGDSDKLTENGWVVLNNETGKTNIVFCALSDNSAETAINLLLSSEPADEPPTEGT